MATARKRFQTGREIMREYVPGYTPGREHLIEPQHLDVNSGDEVAQILLRRFKKGLSKKKLRMKPRRGGA